MDLEQLQLENAGCCETLKQREEEVVALRNAVSVARQSKMKHQERLRLEEQKHAKLLAKQATLEKVQKSIQLLFDIQYHTFTIIMALRRS